MIRLSFVCLLITVLLVSGQEQDNLVNTNVERTIDLVTHLPKETTTVTIENRGTKGTRQYDYLVDGQDASNVAFVGATVKGKKSDDQANLQIKEVKANNNKGTIYRITLPNELAAGQTITLEIETVYVQALKLYPSEITQGERQFVQYKANAHYYSIYQTKTQKTSVTLPTDRAESYTQTPKPVAKNEQSIVYGPYENVGPFSRTDIVLHYENNNPFLIVSNLKRWIEVSHWGNVAIEETIDMYHSGAKLKGPFSRLDFQRRPDSYSAVKSFKTALPASARDIYYRDEIGNISTSHVKELNDQVEVEIRPRFPLYGGWKTHYILGYNVPSYEYLYNKGNQYVLKIRLIDHIYDDQLLEEATIKIVLPEHASNIEVHVPSFSVDRLSDEKHFTYLDTAGRPVIVLKKRNAVFQHIQDFQIQYTFEKVLLLREPMLIVASLFGLFCVVIVLVRLNFSITQNEGQESRLRAQAVLEQVAEENVKRTEIYNKIDEALDAFKKSKETKQFNEQKKKFETDLKSIQQNLDELQKKARNDSVEISEKIKEVQKLDNEQRTQYQSLIGHTEKLVAGKSDKKNFTTEETKIRKTVEEINARISAILN